MFLNYLKIAFRNLLRQKTVSIINIFGLSVAVGCCITVFLFLQNYWTLDDFHLNGERIFMVEYVTNTGGEIQSWGDAPAPMASALLADFPQVEHAIRIKRGGAKVFYKENVFDEIVTYADVDFFHVFTFPLKYGDPSALKDPSAIILSADAAEKYFPGMESTGRTISLIIGDQPQQFTVAGVVESFPNNIGFRFDFLTGYHSVHELLKTQDWTTRTDGLFIQLRSSEDAGFITKQMDRYISLFNVHNPDTPIQSFALDNLRHPAPKAYDVIHRPAEALHPILTIMFTLIAMVMLAVSCFNFVNISLGGVSRRLKEIGIRKVLGGQREQLIAQFMSENLLLCFMSLAIGLMLTETLFVPMLNDIMVMKTSVSFTSNIGLWLMMIVLMAITGLGSGAYPAFYVSSFKPVIIFAGRQKFVSKNVLRRGLLAIQFVLAFLAVIITVVLLTAAQQWKHFAWGYNPDQTLIVRLTESRQYDLLKNEALRNPKVLQVAGSVHHIGQSMRQETLYDDGEGKQNIFRFDVGAGYPEVLGLNLKAGRFFDAERPVEDENSIIVNEAFLEKQAWSDGIGRQVRLAEKKYTIIGVVGDFKLFGTGATYPSAFFRANEKELSCLAIRFTPGTGKEVASQIDRIWEKLFPDMTISRFFQQEVFDGFYQTFTKVSGTFGYVALMTLLIACLGLYGLASQHFLRYTKEVGIRKMLGASAAQILLLINREFLISMLVAGVFATLLSAGGIQLLLSQVKQFTGSFSPGFAPFILADAIIFITATVAVSRQSWNIATINLSNVLKNNE
ncbi:ABC transporter permease [bacterium]|nr:ABC transporter permease [bacterium]